MGQNILTDVLYYLYIACSSAHPLQHTGLQLLAVAVWHKAWPLISKSVASYTATLALYCTCIIQSKCVRSEFEHLPMCEHTQGRSVIDIMHCENGTQIMLPHAEAFGN